MQTRSLMIVATCVLLAGCAGAGASTVALGLVVFLATVAVAACKSDDPSDATVADGSGDAVGEIVEDVVADTLADVADTGCDGNWESACRDGRLVQLCCPANMACNYARDLVACGEDTCVYRPAECPDADTGDVIDDVEVIDDAETVTPSEVVDDADAGCDGTWESACSEGQIVQLCCPVGLACNYGQLMVDCGDGTCVNMPETCPR